MSKELREDGVPKKLRELNPKKKGCNKKEKNMYDEAPWRGNPCHEGTKRR
jgi:hypothetical protein